MEQWAAACAPLDGSLASELLSLDTPSTPVVPRRVPRRLLALAVVVLASIAVAVVAFVRGDVHPEAIRTMVAGAGSLGMLAYVGAVIVAELLWLPRMSVLIAGGLLFGPFWGALLSFVGDSVSALACYGLARGGARAFIAERLARRPRLERVVELLGRRRGAVTLMVLRVCPVAHYTLVSYTAGLVGMPIGTFLLGNSVGLLPCAVLYPMLGDAALRPGSPVFVASLAFAVAMLLGTGWAARRVLRS